MTAGATGLYDVPNVYRHVVENNMKNKDTTAWAISAKNIANEVKWTGWFFEYAAARRFMQAIQEGYIPEYIQHTPAPAWVPGMGTGEELTYELQTVTFLTSNPGTNQTWPVPLDWDDFNNFVEVIGGGADGLTNIFGTTFVVVGAPGGGGAYSRENNIALVGQSTATYRVPNKRALTDPPTGDESNGWFDGSSFDSASVSAQGAFFTGTGVNTVSVGGTAAASTGDVKFSGGGNPAVLAGSGGNGGAGAAGPQGPGRDGGTASPGGQQSVHGAGGGGSNGGSSTVGGNATQSAPGEGGNGNAGTGGGIPGSDGVDGGNGTQGGAGGGGWGNTGADPGDTTVPSNGGDGSADSTWPGNGVGSGGGGAGQGPGRDADPVNPNGGDGALYGGGGGARPAGKDLISLPGNGQQGIIVVTYIPGGRSFQGYVFG